MPYDPAPMRLLLPPSETKSHGGDGPALDPDRLGFPELTDVRRTLLAALGELAADPDRCRAALGLSAHQDAEITRNARLLTSPTTPAISRYTGVLYDALDTASLSPAARRRASRSIVVCSALFGALRPDDPIPAYRFSASTGLPGLGTLAAIWRPSLEHALAAGPGPIIDLRSGAYAALAPLAEAITVRVVAEDGRTVSHHNKAAKGRLVRAFLTAPRQPKTLAALIAAAAATGLTVRRSASHAIEVHI